MNPINVLIIGNGHYATGLTDISGKRLTDKDFGVLLPSVMALKADGIVSEIGIAAKNGAKLQKLLSRLTNWSSKFGWSNKINLFPPEAKDDEQAYINALDSMPKPLVALIAVPDHLHKEVILECINRKIPFLIVKPALISMSDFDEIQNAISKSPVFGMVDYHKVFDEANLLLKQEHDSGIYGHINHAYSLMTQRRDMLDIYKRWLAINPNMNINHYLGSHYIHLLGYITKATPLDVRATRQPSSGVADVIGTHIRWVYPSGHHFSSYHVSAWNDPPETESMTYQELHLLCENGHVDSDQRYRGFRKVLSGQGYEAINPYFFNFTPDVFGKVHFSTKYGFISIKTFIFAAIDWFEGRKTLEELDLFLPTIRESAKVTAILDAADRSLANGSQIVTICQQNGIYNVQSPINPLKA